MYPTESLGAVATPAVRQQSRTHRQCGWQGILSQVTQHKKEYILKYLVAFRAQNNTRSLQKQNAYDMQNSRQQASSQSKLQTISQLAKFALRSLYNKEIKYIKKIYQIHHRQSVQIYLIHNRPFISYRGRRKSNVAKVVIKLDRRFTKYPDHYIQVIVDIWRQGIISSGLTIPSSFDNTSKGRRPKASSVQQIYKARKKKWKKTEDRFNGTTRDQTSCKQKPHFQRMLGSNIWHRVCFARFTLHSLEER